MDGLVSVRLMLAGVTLLSSSVSFFCCPDESVLGGLRREEVD